MEESKTGQPGQGTPDDTPSTNWEELRAQAAKLGITLSELQQKLRLQKLRQKAKGAAKT